MLPLLFDEMKEEHSLIRAPAKGQELTRVHVRQETEQRRKEQEAGAGRLSSPERK